MTSENRTFPFHKISPWLDEPEDLQAPLETDLDADVVVIGGGYTGLAAALGLRRRGADVVLLEQEFAGAGASGRNAGHLTPTIGKDLPTLLRLFGRERAKALVRFADEAVSWTEHVFERHRIDCDYVASGNILAGVHPKQERRLRRAADVARELGAGVRFLDTAQMRERALPPAFLFGVFEERGGTLHPGRYVLGLRRAAIEAGVRLFERTPVTAIEQDERILVRTPHGGVRANRVILATNAYTPRLGWRPRLVVPLRVSLFETEPIDEATLSRLAWRGREGIYTAHEILESYRLTTHGTIVGGSKVVRSAFGTRLPRAYDPAAFGKIERAFRERFPGLRHLSVRSFWGGWIGLTLDFLPVVGSAGRDGNLLYGLGYAGHGVAQATLVGEMLAMRACGERHPLGHALERKQRQWPPEPLRWVGGKILNGLLSALDARTDRQIRRG